MSRRIYELHVYSIAQAAQIPACTVARVYAGHGENNSYERICAAATQLGAPEPPVQSIKRPRRRAVEGAVA